MTSPAWSARLGALVGDGEDDEHEQGREDHLCDEGAAGADVDLAGAAPAVSTEAESSISSRAVEVAKVPQRPRAPTIPPTNWATQ